MIVGKRQNFKNEEVEGEKEEVIGTDVTQEVTIIEDLTPVDHQELGIGKVKCIAFVSNDYKSQLMLKELETRNEIDIVTKVDDDLKDVYKSVTKKLVGEGDIGNSYSLCYLPLSNDDLNRDQSKLLRQMAEIITKTKVNVVCYFADREDQEIKKAAGQAGITI